MATVTAVLGIAGGFFTVYDRMTRPSVDLELLLPYQGWEIRAQNTGRALAKQVRVAMVSWQHGALAPQVRQSSPLHDLVPGGVALVRIDVRFGSNSPGDSDYQRDSAARSLSGYILATCEGCPNPRAWAFYIPTENHHDKWRRMSTGKGVSWPIVEFSYPERLPFLNDCVDYPARVCVTEREPAWTSQSGSSQKGGVRAWPE